MSQQSYFSKFPLINYSGFSARNILVRTKLLDAIQKSGIGLLPYTVQEGERADNISNFYYGSPDYAWAIYLVNNIVDPYHDWFKSEYDLNKFIEQKYGSLEEARNVIVGFRVNWASDNSQILVSQYNSLPYENQKYWDPVFGYGSNILSYKRKVLDWFITNNRVDSLVIETTNSVGFSIGDRIHQYSNTGFLTAKGTIAAISNGLSNTQATVIVNKTTISNTNLIQFIENNGNYFTVGVSPTQIGTVLSATRIDKTSNTQLSVSNSFLTDSEQIYWESVDAETYYRDLNNQKKDIFVLDKQYLNLLDDNLRQLLA